MSFPACSVIVCTYNRLPYLKKCLTSLLELKNTEYEIIVINDGSNDGTREYLDSINNGKISVFHQQKNSGLSIARNKGIQEAKYEIVAFTDDDCIVEKKWLENLTRGFNEDNVGLVIGQTFYISPAYCGYFPERLVNNLNAKWPKGCNIAYRKHVFERVGYFKDEFFWQYNNEDTEMAIRVVDNGYAFNRAPEAINYHQPINWTVKSLTSSARNASVWPRLKKLYPDHYLCFEPDVTWGIFVSGKDYLYFLLLPILLPTLLIRYILHGKKDFKVFFAKWPVWLVLRRWYIWREAKRSKVLML